MNEFPYQEPYPMGGTDGEPEPRDETDSNPKNILGISSSIYPIDSLRKQIQTKRANAFAETCCGNREHKLRFQERVDTFDEVLELIDKGEK